MRKIKSPGLLLILVAALFTTTIRPAYGIPAFARKYGLPCSACHEACQS